MIALSLGDVLLHGWVWTLLLLAAWIVVAVVHERRIWKRVTQASADIRRRSITVTEQGQGATSCLTCC